MDAADLITRDATMFTIYLRDINTAVVDAWEQAFADAPEVLAPHGDIFEHMADAIVSPANSFGYMDGGIDLFYSSYFGWELEANSKTLLSNGITANCRLDRP
jgi:hypothetical protein